jgi:phosphatidylserine decarboxylase
MVTVGATCVGSVILSVKKGDKVKHGDDIGYFEFGGSCIAVIIPIALKNKNKAITVNEQLLKPGVWVCTYQA